MFKCASLVSMCLAYGMSMVPIMALPLFVPLPTPAAQVVGPAPRLLRDIPELQQKITLAVVARPVGDVLTDLSPSLPADLSAERDVADQRVTLHVADQPAYLVMDRLARLLSHHADVSQGYYWRQLDGSAGARPAFQLWRDGHSVNEEKDLLDYPQREMGVLLRDMRNKAGMSPQAQAAYKGDDPYKMGDTSDPFTRAFQGLTDDQLDSLMAGQGVPLDPALFTNEIAALRQRRIDEQNGTVTGRQEDPAEFLGLPDADKDIPMMYVCPQSDDANSDQEPAGSYLISLEGITNSSILINTYDTNQSRSPDHLPQPPPPGPPGPLVDLTPLLTAKGVTRDQRSDVGFTLQALAAAAHINIYQEDFLRGGMQPEPTDTLNVGLTTLNAPLPVLIAALCAHWDYQWQKIGDDYLFWSRTWAQDRADDVPERLIASWRQRLQKQGALTLADRAEIAAALSFPQASLTLARALPASGPWDRFSYPTLHFLGLLEPIQEQQALSLDGLPLTALLPWQQEELASGLKSQLQNVSEDQWSRAVLTLQVVDVPKTYFERATLVGSADGTQLFETQCITLLPKTPTPASPKDNLPVSSQAKAPTASGR